MSSYRPLVLSVAPVSQEGPIHPCPANQKGAGGKHVNHLKRVWTKATNFIVDCSLFIYQIIVPVDEASLVCRFLSVMTCIIRLSNHPSFQIIYLY